ncbi:MAG: ATP synthase subunit C [Defluviitaleaceae bacterium]|nr:ATP synthase subunit C [Defluviitaleaceae bacterium]
MFLILALFAGSILIPITLFYLNLASKFKPTLSKSEATSKIWSSFFKACGGIGGNAPKVSGKFALILNLSLFAIVFFVSTVLIFSGRVYGVDVETNASDTALAAAFIAAGLVTGLGAIGTGIAVSSAAAAAIGAISENENNFGKAMIFVAMAEGIAIYGLLISFMILGRV